MIPGGMQRTGLLSFDELKKRKAIIESGALEESQLDKVPLNPKP